MNWDEMKRKRKLEQKNECLISFVQKSPESFQFIIPPCCRVSFRMFLFLSRAVLCPLPEQSLMNTNKEDMRELAAQLYAVVVSTMTGGELQTAVHNLVKITKDTHVSPVWLGGVGVCSAGVPAEV